MLTERNTFKLTDNEKYIQQIGSRITDLQLDELEAKKLSIIHPNQKKCGQNILHKFYDLLQLTMLLAIGLTQSGKTGVMCACIREFIKSDILEPIPSEHIFIITGLSSKEWKKQTKNRLPQNIQENVLHRNELKTKFKEQLAGKKNVLIMIDEVQIAAGYRQTISKVFEELNLNNIQHLLENDIKIIEFSATPNGTFYDLEEWGDNATCLKLDAGRGYIGCRELLHQNRIKQCQSLCNNDDALKELLIDIKQFPNPRYHIIRTKG